MAKPIVYVDRSRIVTSDLSALKEAISGLVAFVEAREPQLISYGFYLDEDAGTMTVAAVHPDDESLGLHLTIGGPQFRAVGEFIDLQLIEVFGEAGDAVLEQLHQKARMLGTSARVDVHPPLASFARLR